MKKKKIKKYKKENKIKELLSTIVQHVIRIRKNIHRGIAKVFALFAYQWP